MKPICICSDLHPCYHRSLRLFSLLTRVRQEYRALILNGDCWADLLCKTWSTCWNDDFVKAFTANLVETAHAIDVYFIPGNHDPLTGTEGAKLREVLAAPKMHFCGEWLTGDELGLPGWKFSHGHQPAFDPTTTIWSWLLGTGNKISETWTEKTAQWILNLVFGRKPLPSPGDMIRENETEKMLARVDEIGSYNPVPAETKIAKTQHYIHDAHIRWLKKSKDTRVLVCGHTHRPEIVDIGDGRVYINDGAVDGYTNGYLHIESPYNYRQVTVA